MKPVKVGLSPSIGCAIRLPAEIHKCIDKKDNDNGNDNKKLYEGKTVSFNHV
jgi:hypothetical protein